MTDVNGDFVRHATSNDASDGLRLAKLAYQVYLSRMDRPPAPTMYDYNEVFARNESYLYTSNSSIVGMITLHLNDAWVDLSNLAIAPSFQRRGYGRRLLEYAEDFSRANKRWEIRLFTNAAFVENIGMYRKIGYVVTGSAEVDGYKRILMSKIISTSPVAQCE